MVRALSTNLRARRRPRRPGGLGEQALRVAAKRHPDAVILDLSLPGIDGIDVLLRELRGWTRVPIIIVSARRGRGRQGRGPRRRCGRLPGQAVRHGELLARLRAALRREVPDDGEARIVTDDFEVDLVEKRDHRRRPGRAPHAHRVEGAGGPSPQLREAGDGPAAAP